VKHQDIWKGAVANMWVEEKTVHSPWERLPPLVQVVIARSFGKDSAVLRSKMVQVCLVLDLGIVNPCNAYDN
jgi:hypothetical protein